MPAAITRGVRNNNPGNIRHGKANWQGKAADQPDKSFVKFTEPRYGIRAIAVTLITYHDKRVAEDGTQIDTITDVIRRWAPAIENDTDAYIAYVGNRHPKGALGQLDLHRYEDLFPLVEAIIAFENAGHKYPKDVVDAGLRLAGVEPKVKPLRTVETAGAAAGGSGLAGQMFIDTAQQMNAMGPDTGQTVRMVMLGIMMIGFGISAYAMYRRWKHQGVA